MCNSWQNFKQMKRIFKILGKYILIPTTLFYLRKDRNFSYNNLKIKVFKGVFHPGLFFSTKIILRFLKDKPLKSKKFRAAFAAAVAQLPVVIPLTNPLEAGIDKSMTERRIYTS